jgi:hypothetical protein
VVTKIKVKLSVRQLNSYTTYYTSSNGYHLKECFANHCLPPKETWVCASLKSISLRTLVSPPRLTFLQKDHAREQLKPREKAHDRSSDPTEAAEQT